jgi:hypothetical protein
MKLNQRRKKNSDDSSLMLKEVFLKYYISYIFFIFKTDLYCQIKDVYHSAPLVANGKFNK